MTKPKGVPEFVPGRTFQVIVVGRYRRRLSAVIKGIPIKDVDDYKKLRDGISIRESHSTSQARWIICRAGRVTGLNMIVSISAVRQEPKRSVSYCIPAVDCVVRSAIPSWALIRVTGINTVMGIRVRPLFPENRIGRYGMNEKERRTERE